MSNKNVTVYTKPNCMQCNFTKKFLDDNSIRYEIKDIQESEVALAEVKELGFQSLPVVVFDGVEPFFGFRPDLLESLHIRQHQISLQGISGAVFFSQML